MFDAKSLMDRYLGAGTSDALQSKGKSLTDKARENPLAATAIAGGLAAVLLGSKSGRKLGKKALKYGGMAAIAGLAYKAYRDYQAGQGDSGGPAASTGGDPVLMPPDDSDFMPAASSEEARAQALVIAMIQAAKADGFIDDDEKARIIERVDALGMDPDESDFIAREMRSPLDVDKVVRAASSPEVAMELYVASAVAVDPDHPAERAYLSMLAARLGLDPALVANLDQTIAEAREE